MLVVIGGVLTGWHSYPIYMEKKAIEAQLKEKKETEVSVVVDPVNTITYQGARYRRSASIKAILCIGIDNSTPLERKQGYGKAGQADGIFLIAHDVAKDRMKVLMIPRDTMTEITLFDLAGNDLGKEKQHITLAFAYGDGGEKSCELMCETVSELLYGLSIDGYIAMNTHAISILNDAVGGVTVTVASDGLESKDPALAKGNTVTLDGAQAEIFVRYRDITVPQSAIHRMNNQKQYMEAYSFALKSNALKDDNLIVRSMNKAEDLMITNLAKDQYMELGLTLVKEENGSNNFEILTLPGTTAETSLYDEFYMDKEKVQPMILDMFYNMVP